MLILMVENAYKAEQIIKHSQTNSLVFSSAQEGARKFWK
jgi:isocitrate lyase